MSDVPDSLADYQITELGGAIGRKASIACRMGQHDLCGKDIAALKQCECRCHERPPEGFIPINCPGCGRTIHVAPQALRFGLMHCFICGAELPLP